MNLLTIARGWYNFVNQSAAHADRAIERIEVCDGCEHKQQISPAGQMILNAINHESSTYKCGECACPLAAKIFSDVPCYKWKR